MQEFRDTDDFLCLGSDLAPDSLDALCSDLEVGYTSS
jgi:hypothetical protein